jgi:hypothetical protein
MHSLPSSTLRRASRGFAVLEFALVLLPTALVLVLFIGFGQILLLRQHALVSSRYAAFYYRIAGKPPVSQVAAASVSATEDWHLNSESLAALDTGYHELLNSLSRVAELRSAFLAERLNDGTSIECETSHHPDHPLIPKFLHLNDVRGQYYVLPASTWTTDEPGLFMGLLSRTVWFTAGIGNSL